MKNELTVYQKRAAKKAFLPVFLNIFWTFQVFQLLCFTLLRGQWWGAYIAIVGCFGFLVFIIFYMYEYSKILKQPFLIMNQKGIWIKNQGLIPWSNIALMWEIEGPQPKPIWLFKKSRRHYLGIKLKDSSALKTLQGSYDEHLRIIQSNSLYDIVLSDFDTASIEIILFAQQFMK